MPDSTELGFITPDTEPIEDAALEDIFQQAIAGITGIAGNLVRPSVQPTTPNLPDYSINWVAFLVTVLGADQDAYVEHQPALYVNGGSKVYRDERLEVKLSFYGPQGKARMTRWRDGLALDQNRWTLQDHGIKLISQGDPVNLPALQKDRWVPRVDITTTFSRRAVTAYPIRSISIADVEIHNESTVTHISTTPPP